MKRNDCLLVAAILFGILFSSCQSGHQENELTADEKKDGWILLFDGKTENGWHLYNHENIPDPWSVADGELLCGPKTGKGTYQHADLVTDSIFKNFDLHFDWKLEKGGNSGVFVNVAEGPDLPRAWTSGPEYQLLDSSHADYAKPDKRSGCMFGFGAPLNPVQPLPPGEWNQSRIKQVDGKIEFWLNGILTARQDFKSQAWLDSVAHSNFQRYPAFGTHTEGHLGIQYWEKGVAFRNIKLKQL